MVAVRNRYLLWYAEGKWTCWKMQNFNRCKEKSYINIITSWGGRPRWFFDWGDAFPPLSAPMVTSEREARSEFLLIYTKNLSMSGRPARRPWLRFWEAYISGTVSPIDKRSSLVGNPIPSAVYGTNAEACQCLLWHVARTTWGCHKCSACCFSVTAGPIALKFGMHLGTH